MRFLERLFSPWYFRDGMGFWDRLGSLFAPWSSPEEGSDSEHPELRLFKHAIACSARAPAGAWDVHWITCYPCVDADEIARARASAHAGEWPEGEGRFDPLADIWSLYIAVKRDTPPDAGPADRVWIEVLSPFEPVPCSVLASWQDRGEPCPARFERVACVPFNV